MSHQIRVFVNERAIEVADGATALDAVRALDQALAIRVAQRSAYLTDGRGIELGGESKLAAGAIVRVVLSARSRSAADAET
ncbi:MAG TPA: hypothetical protein VLT17_00030 [Gemmatimonadales bacterium]|nr:hypothetical protein [Gemmatimonadales bacterium]